MKSELKSKLIEISKKFNLDLLVLFGSRANGDFRENSDWDFAFYSVKSIGFEQYSNLLNGLMDLLKIENIDLIDLKEQDNPILINEIFEKGLLIYEKRKGLFDTMQTNAWFNYVDYKPFIEERNKLIKESLKKMIKNGI